MGGGLSGLLAAILLARRGHRVTVVERDQSPPCASPDVVFSDWERRGVPQSRQPHIFLGRSVRVLRDEAPDILDELLAAGALRLPVDLGDGPHDAVVCCRRLTFEAVLWRAAQRERGVTHCSGTGVTDFLFGQSEGLGTARVRGVYLEGGGSLTADLVVDASGRRSPTPRILARRGLRPLPEQGQECGLLYISRHFRLRRGGDFPSLDVPIMARLGWALAMAFPADRQTFCLLAAVAAIDPLRRVLTTPEGFSRFHDSVPLMAPWLNAGEPINETHTMARVDNRYRRLVDEAGPIVEGLLLLGDAAMHTNPTAGRGVSLAFAHVQHLVSIIDRAQSPTDLTLAFDAWTEANIAAWYQLQAGADASLLRRAEAAVRGETLPPPDRSEQIRTVIIEASKQQTPAGVRLRRMRNLVALPSEVLGDPGVIEAAGQMLDRHPGGELLTAGPSRESFAAATFPISSRD
jgi:2-polyprenyl-6-methoxyphenol hydroxylase-like FAD-dependent oxidoreductase